MKDTLEYKILKYLSENDNGEAIEVLQLHNEKQFLKKILSNLRKEKLIKFRVISNESIIAIIELKGKEYLNKIESNNSITNNFNGSTIGQLNQDSDLKDLIIDIKQTIHPNTNEKQQSAIVKFIEKWFWQIVIPLLLGIVLIAIEKNWNIINNFNLLDT